MRFLLEVEVLVILMMIYWLFLDMVMYLNMVVRNEGKLFDYRENVIEILVCIR